MHNTIPNLLTFFRIGLIPIFILVFYLPWDWSYTAAAAVFCAAAITDWFDGFLARHLNQTTALGAFLDPVADKVMVASALIIICEHYASLLITLPSLMIICREIIISALREWMAEIGQRSKVAVSNIGKWKTTAQMIAIIGLLWQPNLYIVWFSYVFLYIATVLTFQSMWQYLQASWSEMQRQHRP